MQLMTKTNESNTSYMQETFQVSITILCSKRVTAVPVPNPCHIQKTDANRDQVWLSNPFSDSLCTRR